MKTNSASPDTADKGGSFFVTQPTGAVNSVIPVRPEFIRLPRAGVLCAWSGLSRSKLNDLILSRGERTRPGEVVQRSQKEPAERKPPNRLAKPSGRSSWDAKRAGRGMKLHSHKFIHHFIDGNRCIMKVTRSNIIKLRWKWRPDETLVDEYRTWRTRIILALHPEKRVMVVER